jgi:hypothetical protein
MPSCAHAAPCHANTMLFWKRILKAAAQSGLGAVWEWHV